jgi:hypothetical protein
MIIIAGYVVTDARKRDAAVSAFANLVEEQGSMTAASTCRSARTRSIPNASISSSAGAINHP